MELIASTWALMPPAFAGDFSDCVADRLAIERGFPDRAIHSCSRALKLGYLTTNGVAAATNSHCRGVNSIPSTNKKNLTATEVIEPLR